PSEISRVPTEEILFPIGQQLRIVGGAPAPRNRVALEIDVGLALLGLREQLGMGYQRVWIRPEYRLIGRELPNGRVIVQEPAGPRNKVLPIRSVSVASVVLAPCELAFEKPYIDRRHFRRDRKSTRLNSSHVAISYAVFCLKKKTRRA